MKIKPHRNGKTAKRVTISKRMVMMEEADYDDLLRKVYADEPDMPAPNAAGNYPALETLDVLQARDILRARRKLGLSQAELARRAGIRAETLNRIEQGRHKPSVPTIAKIDKALKKAEADAAGFLFPVPVWFIAPPPPYADVDEFCRIALCGTFDDGASGLTVPVVYAFSDRDLAGRYLARYGSAAASYAPFSPADDGALTQTLKGLQRHGHQFLLIDAERTHSAVARIASVIDQIERR